MYSIVAAAYIIATRHALHVYSIEMLVRLLLLPYTPYSNAEADSINKNNIFFVKTHFLYNSP